MNYNHFVTEALRSVDIKPRPVTDPKTKEGKTQQAIRDAGDVGKPEMLQKITGKTVKNARQFRKVGRQVATDAGVAQFGDTQDPVDRALDLTRAPARYQQQRELERKAEVDSLGMRPKSRKRPDKPGKMFDKWQEREREIQRYDKSAAELDDTEGLDPDEYDKLPQAERQRRAVEAGREVGRFSAQGEVEDALDQASIASAEPEAREPINIKTKDGQDIEVADSPNLRHRFQRSGIDVGDKEEDPDYDEDEERNPRELVDADIDTIMSGMIDPEKQQTNISADQLISKGGKERAHSQTPTKRDLEQIYRYQQDFTTALQKEDSKAIQDMSFKYDIDDKKLNKFIDRFGQSIRGNDELVEKFKMSGLTPERMGETYGGDLGPEAAEFRVEGAPDGVYDFDKMKEKNKELFNKALINRGREALRTYLKQGGADAYAQHEGLRSIGDMDLEHIRALQSQQPDGNGYDHPDNWVWASGPMNRLRGNKPLTRAAKKFDAGKEVKSYDKGSVLKSYNDHIKSAIGERPKGRGTKDAQAEWDELKAMIDDDLGGKPTSAGGSGPFAAPATIARTPEERKTEIKRLVDLGFPKKAAEGIVAKVESEQDIETRVNAPGVVGQETRTGGKPLAAGEEDYEQDTKTEFRDETMYQKGLFKLGQLPEFEGKTDDVIRNSDEGRNLLGAIKGMGPAAIPKGKDKPIVTIDDDDI